MPELFKDVTKMTEAELDAEAKRQTILQMRLNTGRLQVENLQAASAKQGLERRKIAMQQQLKGEAKVKVEMRTLCNHRQGNTPKKRYQGNGTTALKIAKMPDGITTKVHCMNCTAEWWSPLPTNKSPKPKFLKKQNRMETKDEVAARVELYKAEQAEFDAILAKAQDGITEEQTTAMDPGVKMRVTDGDGLPVYRERPCDTYATRAAAVRELVAA